VSDFGGPCPRLRPRITLGYAGLCLSVAAIHIHTDATKPETRRRAPGLQRTRAISLVTPLRGLILPARSAGATAVRHWHYYICGRAFINQHSAFSNSHSSIPLRPSYGISASKSQSAIRFERIISTSPSSTAIIIYVQL